MIFNIYKLPLVVFLLSFCLGWASDSNRVERGKIDLSHFPFDSQIAELSGEWEFYYDTLLYPEDFIRDSGYLRLRTFGSVPGFWKNYDTSFTTFKACTYRCRVKMHQTKSLLALRLSNVHNCYKLWINGVELIEVGKVSNVAGVAVARWKPAVLPISDQSQDFDIIIQVANFHHRNGGFQDPIKLSNAELLYNKEESQNFGELFIAGSLIVLGLFFMGMFLFWKEDKASLFFGLFTFSYAGRVLFYGTRPLLDIFPDISWEVAVKIEYMGMFLSGLFFMWFVYYIFPGRMKLWILRFLQIYNLGAFCLTLFAPAKIYCHLAIPNSLLLLSFPFILFPIFIKALRAKEVGAKWAIISMGISIVNFSFLVLEYLNVVVTNPIYISLGFIAFVLSMSFIFASRFGRAFYHVEELKDVASEQNIKMRELNVQISHQLEEMVEQKGEIEHQHELITDSITYAQRIQRSLLPEKEDINKWLTNSFVFFRPQNVVSGDFYFCRLHESTNEVILAIADCTGHGVPGAFMSIVGINSLDNILIDAPLAGPREILERLNHEIQRKITISSSTEVRDGMDIAVCRINRDTNELRFAAAHHKMLYVKADGTKEEIKGCNHFIGDNFDDNFTFQERIIQMQPGDEVFMFSDGTFDQKGGPRGKRLYYQRLEEMLLEVHPKPTTEQHDEMERQLLGWMGDEEQIDDMLLFGWKLQGLKS